MTEYKKLTWFAFAACWLAIYFYCDYMVLWYSNIPAEIINSGYIDAERKENWLAYLVAYGVPTYLVLYAVFILVQRLRKKLTLLYYLLLLTPVVVALIIVLLLKVQLQQVEPVGFS